MGPASGICPTCASQSLEGPEHWLVNIVSGWRDGTLSQAPGRRRRNDWAVNPSSQNTLVFLDGLPEEHNNTHSQKPPLTPHTVCRAPTGHGKCGAERWGERGWDSQSPLHTSPQLGVNNDSVQVGLYCFWLQAFYRNNCNSCQGSFCPQLRGKNKEQRWECLHLILVPRNTQEGQQAWLPTGMGYGTAVSTLGCASQATPKCFRHLSSLGLLQSRGLCLY